MRVKLIQDWMQCRALVRVLNFLVLFPACWLLVMLRTVPWRHWRGLKIGWVDPRSSSNVTVKRRILLCLRRRDFRRWLQTDRRAEPRISERVPYVIVNGPPGLPLIRLVRSPLDLLTDPSLRPNATYYITRVIIPPLDRCFSLLGAEVESWYDAEQFITNLRDVLVLHLMFTFLLHTTSSPHRNFLN